MGFKIVIIDYEMGNLKSIYKCLVHLQINVAISDDPKTIMSADGLILPGVGAFGIAMDYLNRKKLVGVIDDFISTNRPLLGICLGLQLLFTKSVEMGEHYGLHKIDGDVVCFDKKNVPKIPHIGWNNIELVNNNHFLVEDIPNDSYFYFVHSYYGVPSNKDIDVAITEYGNTRFSSIIANKHIVATQFHPEKSGKVGIQLLKNFIKFCKK